MKKIATYKLIDNKKIFELIRDEITTKYVDDDGKIREKVIKVVNSTYILPTQMPTDNQILYFIGDDENGEWQIFEKQVFGQFFLKENGNKFDIINLCDFDKYTKIIPLTINDQSTQKFNDDTQLWEYVFIDKELALFNKMQEFNNFLLKKNVDKCKIRLFDNNVIVLVLNEYIPEARRVLSNKINNGETFEYELRGQNKSIINIPKAEAVRLFTQIENYDTKLGMYKRYYNNLILEAKTEEELNNIVFQENIVITEQEFVVELLKLDFYLLDGIEIVDTIPNNSDKEN